MSGEKTLTQEQLQADLSARLGAAIATYAEERGLTKEEVMQTARELLLNEPSS
ncbi:MAG: hypothetical protein JWM39_633 [Parcubacteria group bacterium]|nr:hypothetical protein [Parcubacteria group bacterium]